MFNFNKLFETPNKNEDLEERARVIASGGNYREIVEKLKDEDLLEAEIARVRTEYQEDLSDIDFLTDKDMEIFTVIELYDKELAHHSIETYRIAKEKISKRLDYGIVLTDLMKQEGVSRSEFLRACFLHDVGKVEIPSFILNNKVSIDEMNVILSNIVFKNKDQDVIDKINQIAGADISDLKDEEALIKILRKSNLRSVHFVPAKEILRPDEQTKLVERGFDLNMSIIDIIKHHEEYSKNILEQADLKIESELAGSHHNYHGQGSPYPISVDSLTISSDLAELITLSDIEEALTASRTYNQSGFSKPKALSIIMEEVDNGLIKDPKIAYLWVNDEIKMLEENPPEDLTEEDKKDIALVKSHLEKIHQEIERAKAMQKKAA